jgi:hypothetical protein
MQIPSGPLKEWGVLVYSSASPDIEAAADASLREIEAAPRSDSVGVAVQYGTQDGVRRWRLGEASTAVDGGMNEPSTLTDFLRWGMRAVPAQRYMVVVGGHGGGFLGVVTDAERSRLMSADGLAQAFAAAGARPDVLVMNACLMAQAEVAVEMMPHARWMVAAQGLEEGVGMPLGRVVSMLDEGATAEQAAAAVVDACAATPERTPTVSAVNLEQAGALRDALDDLGRAILEHPRHAAALRAHIEKTRGFYDHQPWDRPLSDLRDLGDFARRVGNDSTLKDLHAASRALLQTLRAAVAAHVPASVSGMSAYLPTQRLEDTHGPSGLAAQAKYDRLALSRQTVWDDALASLAGRPL